MRQASRTQLSVKSDSDAYRLKYSPCQSRSYIALCNINFDGKNAACQQDNLFSPWLKPGAVKQIEKLSNLCTSVVVIHCSGHLNLSSILFGWSEWTGLGTASSIVFILWAQKKDTFGVCLVATTWSFIGKAKTLVVNFNGSKHTYLLPSTEERVVFQKIFRNWKVASILGIVAESVDRIWVVQQEGEPAFESAWIP